MPQLFKRQGTYSKQASLGYNIDATPAQALERNRFTAAHRSSQSIIADAELKNMYITKEIFLLSDIEIKNIYPFKDSDFEV